MIKVKKILGDDIFGLWHVKRIIVKKDGTRFCFTPDHETFITKNEAEIHARDRVRYFLQRELGVANADVLCERGDSCKGESIFARAIKFVPTLVSRR